LEAIAKMALSDVDTQLRPPRHQYLLGGELEIVIDIQDNIIAGYRLFNLFGGSPLNLILINGNNIQTIRAVQIDSYCFSIPLLPTRL
jgi:hypothetical protein